MRPLPSNPITGLSPRPEQANQGTPWWKYDGPHQDPNFPSQPQACCGRCQGIVHDFITSVEFKFPDQTYTPYNLKELLFVSSPIRSVYQNEQEALPPQNIPLNESSGPLLEYRRCHWKTAKEQAAVNVAGPPGPGNPPDVKGMLLQAWMFYGQSHQVAGGATGPTDIGNEGVALFNGLPWIADDFDAIRSPLALTDSFVYLDAPDYDTLGAEANLEIDGWCICISNRKYVPAPGPDFFDALYYQPIFLYQLAGPVIDGILQPALHPFRCRGENKWYPVFNPLKADEHLLITKPFQP